LVTVPEPVYVEFTVANAVDVTLGCPTVDCPPVALRASNVMSIRSILPKIYLSIGLDQKKPIMMDTHFAMVYLIFPSIVVVSNYNVEINSDAAAFLYYIILDLIDF